MSPRRPSGPRRYPRTARLNQLIHEIVAEELERVDDDRLGLVTVMGVEVEADLRHAIVYFDTVAPATEPGDEEVLSALAAARTRLQSAIGRQARIKRVPELRFEADTVNRQASRLDEILRGLRSEETTNPEDS
jgi:ribosome-binding factor A